MKWSTITKLLGFIMKFLSYMKWKNRAKELEKEKEQLEKELEGEKETSDAEREIRDAVDKTKPHGGGGDDDLLNSDEWNKNAK